MSKVFLTKWSKLEDRFDAQFYWANINFDNCIKLSKIAKVSGGKRLPKGFDYSKEKTEYRYLRIGNISWDGTLDYDNFNYISKELYDILKNYEIKNGDILLAIVGATIGKCSLLNIPNNDRVILTENCTKIKITDENVLPDFLLLLLQTNFIQKQIQLNYIQTTLPKLGLDRVLSLYIPNPPSRERQQALLDIYTFAFLSKQKADEEAKKLLESIDDYLLQELGITLPKEESNDITQRIFTRNWSEVSGNRIDSEFYQLSFKNFHNSISHRFYKLETIGEISSYIASGATPTAGGSDYVENSEYNFLRIVNFTNDLEVDLSNSYYVTQNIYEGMLKRVQLQYGDVLFGIAGSIGKTAIYEHCTKSVVNQAIALLRFKNNINNLFVAFVLNSEIVKKQIKRLQRPTAQPNLNTEELKSLQIPLPPPEKQNEIASHITAIRQKAKALKENALSNFEKAKAEVEKMILGEDE